MSTVPIIQKKIGWPYSRIVATMSMTPAAGNTRNGSIAATPHGSGSTIHHAAAHAKVASVTWPAYGNATGAHITSANTTGPPASRIRYPIVDGARAVAGGVMVSVIMRTLTLRADVSTEKLNDAARHCFFRLVVDRDVPVLRAG